jgi:mannose-6-phosphate isomerase-like protein (cupin superfamily)
MEMGRKPEVINESDVNLVGPGHDESHYITVPIKPFYEIEDLGNIGVCLMQPGQETCVFSLEEDDDGTTLHYYGPVDEFYYILEGELTLWWGKNAEDLENSQVLKPGDCTYYPTGWKYKVKNTGSEPVKFLYFITRQSDIERRLDHPG